MIIDLSYFTGQIHLAKLDDLSVQEKVNRFIIQFEIEYLERMLGYQLASDFITGLQQPVIDQKWIDLLIGATYTNYAGVMAKWKGFSNTLSYPILGTTDSSYAWIVGTVNSPATGTTAFIDTRTLGKQFFIERRGFGTLLREGSPSVLTGTGNYSYDPSTQTITLLDAGVTFQQGEVYIVHVTGYAGAINFTQVNISPIAYYVYWKIVANNVTETTSMGERLNSTENSTAVSPRQKMVTAWNNMVDLNRSLVGFLNANRTVYYPNGYMNYGCERNGLLTHTNIFDI